MTRVECSIPMSRMEEITAWLHNTIGPGWLHPDIHVWSYGERYESVHFSRERDAIMFKLKWARNENI
jgi:hypothetical protein